MSPLMPTLPLAPVSRRITHLALLAAALLPLAACGGAPSDGFAPVCPQLALLKDGADITRFRPRGHDVTDLLLDGRLTGVPAKCAPGPHGTVEATLNVQMRLQRGPAATGRTADVPYFVAVTRNGQVLDKQVYVQRVTFPPNVEQIGTTGDDVVLDIPVDAQTSASAYNIFVGFQLTPEELETNRKRGAR